MGKENWKFLRRKMNEEELNDLKYRQLQKLAKENGLKANLQKSALVEALLEFFEKNKDCPDSVETEIESVTEPPKEENLDLQTENQAAENEEKVPENTSNSRKNPSRKRDKSKKDSGVQNETPKEENLDLSEESMPEKLENQSENSPKSKRNSKKRNSKTKKDSETLNETPKEENVDTMPKE